MHIVIAEKNWIIIITDDCLREKKCVLLPLAETLKIPRDSLRFLLYQPLTFSFPEVINV